MAQIQIVVKNIVDFLGSKNLFDCERWKQLHVYRSMVGWVDGAFATEIV